MNSPENLEDLLHDESENKPVGHEVSLHSGEESWEMRDDAGDIAMQSDSTGSAVARATAGIGFLHVIRLLVGFIAQPLIANRMALTASADVYTVATDIVTSIWRFFEKVVNPTFLPCFIGSLKDEGEERAWRFTSTALWLTLLALVPTTLLSWALMPQIVALYSRKASPEQVHQTIDMARLMLAGLCFLGVSSLSYVILNGYKRFFWAALGDVLWKSGILVGAVIAVALKLDPQQSLSFLGWGFLIGSIAKLLPHLAALHAKLKLLRPRVDWSDPLVRKMLWLGVPLLAGIVISEGRDVYIKSLADSPLILVNGQAVEGSRTALKFSRTIGDSLIQIFPYALSIGIFPYLADLAHAKDKQKLTDTLLGALRACIWIFAPVTAILIALRFPLLRAVWESGQFGQGDTFVLSLPFVFYTLGLVGFACEMMLNQTFYAMTNVWAPTLVGVAMTGLNMSVATLGVHWGWGLAAIAIAESLSKTVKCLILWMLLRKSLGDVRVRRNLLFFGKVLLGSLFAALVAYSISLGIAPTGEVLGRGGKIKMLLAVAMSGTGGMIAFLFWCRLTAVEETQSLFDFLAKLRRRFAR